jgi:hypothetical protein
MFDEMPIFFWADAILECRLLVLIFGLIAGFIAE